MKDHHKMPPVEEISLAIMRTRIESARIEIPCFPTNFDMKVVLKRCEHSLDYTLHYAAEITSPGIERETVKVKYPKNFWHHFLRNLSSILPDRLSTWVKSKVKYRTIELKCTDLWPQINLPKPFGEVVRTMNFSQPPQSPKPKNCIPEIEI